MRRTWDFLIGILVGIIIGILLMVYYVCKPDYDEYKKRNKKD